MIPKIIHYCWLSDGPLPRDFQAYIDGWQRLLPDYQLRRWDFKRFPRGKSAWVDEAFDKGKFAFAADYIRNYALFTEGGIYLDADVELLKSFDPFLHLPYFLCFENGTGNIEAAVMGSEAGNPFYGRMLHYYEGRHFVAPDGSMDMLPLPKIYAKVNSGYNIKRIDSIDEFDRSPQVLSVLPFEYFSPIHIETRQLQSTERTVAIHRFAGSWQPLTLKLKKRLKLMLGSKLTSLLIRTKRKIKRN